MRGLLHCASAVALLGLAACGAEPDPGTPYHLEHAGLRAELSEHGATIGQARAAPWVFDAAPRRFGCDGALAEVGIARPASAGDHVEYRHPGLVEWYADTPAGIEQGFTLATPPCAGNGRGVVVEVGGGLRAVVSAGGRSARLRDASGLDVLRYTDLRAADATGRALPAALEARDEGLAIRVDDRGAVYPVEIDPLMWTPITMLTHGGDAPNDGFGAAIALDGDTLLVGAPDATGAAFVFVRSGTTWSEQTKLTVSDDAGADAFGTAVALSGDTAFVGAPSRDARDGAVYVFERTGTTWAETQMLLPPDGSAGGQLGINVALDGDTAVVGALGAAHVYVRTGSTWTLQQTLVDALPNDTFGVAVAIDGDTAVIGSASTLWNPDTVQVFSRSGTVWSQQASFHMSGPATGDFGASIAVKGDTAIVGAPMDKVAPSPGAGAAFVLSRTGTTWAMGQEIDGDPGQREFGQTVALDGATLVVMPVVGSPTDEGAIIYGLDGGTFARQAVLLGSDVGDTVKSACAIQGSTLVTGTRSNDAVVVLGLVAAAGNPCSAAGDCDSGFCVDGVCCENPSCPAAGPCNAAEHCQPGTGMCSNTPLHEGAACDAHDACMHDAVCQQGACVGPTKTCAPPDECQEFGTCDPATGACSSPPKPDGTACAGGVCMDGACDTGSAPTPAPSAHGCGCEVVGAEGGGAVGVGVGLLLLLPRRRRRAMR